MTTEHLPTKLGSEPIVDAICEIRFEADSSHVVNLLPGLFLAQFGEFDEIENLPIAGIPTELLGEEALKFQPHVRLRKNNLFISIGPSMLSASNLPPYLGWADFSEYAFRVFSVLRDRTFIRKITRLSLRYTDIIVAEGSGLGMLNSEVRLGSVSDHDNFHVRMEGPRQDARVIVQAAGPASAFDGRKGVVVDVDVFIDAPTDFWGQHSAIYSRLHKINKEVFFSILKPSTVESLKPEY